MPQRIKAGWLVAGVLSAPLAFLPSQGKQRANEAEQEQARRILHQAEEAVKAQYYDPTFHGFDLRARFNDAEKKISDSPTLDTAIAHVAWAVEGLNDSHTFFIPPARSVFVEKNWQMEMVGEKCLISAVRPDEDPWKQGLRSGDEVLRVETYIPTRSTFAQIAYHLNVLTPLAEYHLKVAAPGQSPRDLVVKSHLTTLPETVNEFTRNDFIRQALRLREGYELTTKTRTADASEKVMVWKMPEFNLREQEIGRLVDSARHHDVLILDLRDNPGGGNEPLRWMIGAFFDHDVTVGDVIERKGKKPMHISSRGNKAFSGRLLVLVNSRSASAAEIFVRTVQLQKRGMVIGDKTAGHVGRAEHFRFQETGKGFFWCAMQITTARLQMPDGQDLEGTGVTPDLRILPTPSDLASGRDPVLAAAVSLAGVPMEPDKAGMLFPTVWERH